MYICILLQIKKYLPRLSVFMIENVTGLQPSSRKIFEDRQGFQELQRSSRLFKSEFWRSSKKRQNKLKKTLQELGIFKIVKDFHDLQIVLKMISQLQFFSCKIVTINFLNVALF